MSITYTSSIAPELFPRAASYAGRTSRTPPALRESSARSRRFPWSERHLQCVWFDPALRRSPLRTSDGEPVTVEDPGIWNLEAGPDFRGAAIRVGPDRRRLAGDVEIHVHPADWAGHGHGSDPRYDGVRIHVTYFPATGPVPQPPGTILIVLRDALAADPCFSFDTIDLAAYPFAARANPPPCSRMLAEWNPDERGAWLDSAGEERLRRKAERLAGLIEDRGTDQVLYEEVCCALGYKGNKAPFRRLAELLPLATLRDESRGHVGAAYALLMGVAGLLPDKAGPRWDADTKTQVRSLWDAWWKRRERWEGRIMPRGAWQIAGLRPANRPERRIAAAASLFIGSTPPEQSDRFVDIARRWLESASDRYWDRRLSFSGARQNKAVALIGGARIDAIVNNVLVPFLAAGGSHPAGLLDQLPAEAENAIVRQTALSLFGPDYPPSLIRSGLRQQGLIQIFHDFCLNDRSRCASCALPHALEKTR